jgi:hypothetical protein
VIKGKVSLFLVSRIIIVVMDMISVKGKIENGKVLALEPVDEAFEGLEVQILIDREQPAPDTNVGGLGSLLAYIEENSIDTGITDMAHQHDHYLYGTPKRDDQ